MKRFFLVAVCSLLVTSSFAQTINQKLLKAFQQFENDVQLKNAISSLYVIDAKTGKVVFDKNSQIGLAPASTQKIITSVTAFELLGKDYRYKTEFYYQKPPENSFGQYVMIKATGDPTFGSWRYPETTPDSIISKLAEQLNKRNLPAQKITFFLIDTFFEKTSIPDGWIWQDIGNYYGAGAAAFNWKENQSDIKLSSSAILGSQVTITNYDSIFVPGTIQNDLKAAAKGTGDNAYYYFAYGNSNKTFPVLKGSIPVNEKNYKISIAVADPFSVFKSDFDNYSMHLADADKPDNGMYFLKKGVDSFISPSPQIIYTHYSPALDSIIYWLNRKSINLYGEALIKTFAYENKGVGSTDSGIDMVKDFWKQNGIDENELNISDGSGLSPQNRVTTHAQVQILKYAATRDWFASFYHSLPEHNGMKIKSGTIKNVKGFCGYHKAKEGTEYIFSFLVNNYNGPASGLVNKMYKVMNILK